MARLLTAAALNASFAARFPNAHAGTIDSVTASADTVPTVQAAAVKGFSAVNSKLQWVKAKGHFFVSIGETVTDGDFVQVEENDAKRLVRSGLAELATDAEVAAAQA